MASYSDANRSTGKKASSNGSASYASFPYKLRDMLDSVDSTGLTHIVSWEMEGKAFKVHDTKAFVSTIMPFYFNQTKYKSFQRQLNLYGFNRYSKGPNKGCYLHDNFQRDQPREACNGIIRKKASDDDDDAEYMSPDWLPPTPTSLDGFGVEPDPINESVLRGNNEQVVPPPAVAAAATAAVPSFIDQCETFFQHGVAPQYNPQPQNEMAMKKPAAIDKGAKASSGGSNALSRMIDSMIGSSDPGAVNRAATDQSHQVLPWVKDDTVADGSAADAMLKLQGSKPPAIIEEDDAQSKKKNSKPRIAAFPNKLHDMLEYAEANDCSDVVSWQMRGRGFKIHEHKRFIAEILPLFFKQTKYESLQRQLNLYGFTRIPKGPMKGCYHHPMFNRDNRDLSKQMSRKRDEAATPEPMDSKPPPSKRQKQDRRMPVGPVAIAPTPAPVLTNASETELSPAPLPLPLTNNRMVGPSVYPQGVTMASPSGQITQQSLVTQMGMSDSLRIQQILIQQQRQQEATLKSLKDQVDQLFMQNQIAQSTFAGLSQAPIASAPWMGLLNGQQQSILGGNNVGMNMGLNMNLNMGINLGQMQRSQQAQQQSTQQPQQATTARLAMMNMSNLLLSQNSNVGNSMAHTIAPDQTTNIDSSGSTGTEGNFSW